MIATSEVVVAGLVRADAVLADGSLTGPAETALDLAAGLHLPDTANNRRTNEDTH